MDILTLSPRRLLVGVLALLTTGAATWFFFETLREQGWSVLALLLLGFFIVLFFWTALSFWLATVGFLRCLFARSPEIATPTERNNAPLDPGVRTAILMPIYNEDPHSVLAGLRATFDSLCATGQAAGFDFFLLSDTTDPDLWLAEELAWAQLNATLAGTCRVFYRHRLKNTCRKAGNIADFCERWGSDYRYMIVLDADSVMSGATLVEMVRRMEADHELGILQVPPMPVNRVSLFARCQQFAACVYGPVFLEGFAWWSQTDGNYWGHNAIIRIAPFTRHCGLSALPGAPPLGGEILSHDFVEAALMRRAGLKVCLAQDLEGSYEESPPTLIDYAQRDQRWCQGNLQHMRLVLSYGLPPMSRMHLGMGAMAYLSSPLWLVFMILSALWVVMPADGEPDALERNWPTGGLLFGVTMMLLLMPKLWGYLLLLRNPRRLAGCGGGFKALASVAIETLLSILVAPIMMAFHVVFVTSTLVGFQVGWSAQQRSEQGQALLPALAAHWRQTLAGIATAGLAFFIAPCMLAWLAPVFAGLILAVPLSVMLSSVSVGQALAGLGLLVTPAETTPPRVLRRLRDLQGGELGDDERQPDCRSMFMHLLIDPVFAELHRSVLLATAADCPADPAQIRRATTQIRAGAAQRISAADRKALQSDPCALGALSLERWIAWGTAAIHGN